MSDEETSALRPRRRRLRGIVLALLAVALVAVLGSGISPWPSSLLIR